jgi:hypothetical protein
MESNEEYLKKMAYMQSERQAGGAISHQLGQGLDHAIDGRPRDASPVEQALNRLNEAISHANAEGMVLAKRLGPVTVQRPTEEQKTGGACPTSCEIEERVNSMFEKVIHTTRMLIELRESLCI